MVWVSSLGGLSVAAFPLVLDHDRCSADFLIFAALLAR
jgi:hypothetical protein